MWLIYFTSGKNILYFKTITKYQRSRKYVYKGNTKRTFTCCTNKRYTKYLKLVNVNEKIICKNAFYNGLVEKYKLKYELPTRYPKLDITEQYNLIAENGLIEKFCLTKEEKSIVNALREQDKKSKNATQLCYIF